MDLGARIKQARLEAGLSQRALCAGKITRNMLSQIENGTARPSMDTLCFLAARLEKPVGFFLEEGAVTSPNQARMAQSRAAWEAGEYRRVMELLADYISPDPTFDRERVLLEALSTLALAEAAAQDGRARYAENMLEELGPIRGYCGDELERRRTLLLSRVKPQGHAQLCSRLPSLDGELHLRARAALEAGQFARAGALLDAAEDQTCPDWNFLRGEVYLAQEQYQAAARCFHQAEQVFPQQTASRLEQCYRELQDYRQAYFYACQQKK